MGRWAQAKRRGGGANGSNPTPPLVTIDAVVSSTLNAYQLQFSAPIVYDGSGTLNSFEIDVDPAVTVLTGAGSTSILDVLMAVADGPGLTWLLSAQPPEISTPLVAVQSGTTT